MTWVIVIGLLILTGLVFQGLPGALRRHEQIRRRVAEGEPEVERFRVLTAWSVEDAEKAMTALWGAIAQTLVGTQVFELHRLADRVHRNHDTTVAFIVGCHPELVTAVKARIEDAFPDQVSFQPYAKDPLVELDRACFPGPMVDHWPRWLRPLRGLLR